MHDSVMKLERRLTGHPMGSGPLRQKTFTPQQTTVPAVHRRLCSIQTPLRNKVKMLLLIIKLRASGALSLEVVEELCISGRPQPLCSIGSPLLHHLRGFLNAANGHEPFLDGNNKRVKVKLYLGAASLTSHL